MKRLTGSAQSAGLLRACSRARHVVSGFIDASLRNIGPCFVSRRFNSSMSFILFSSH